MNDCIDFKSVKQSVSMEMLIVDYGLHRLKRRGAEVRLQCPFHDGKSHSSLAIDLEKNRFYCYGCQAKGGVLDFVSRYENCSVKEAALRLDKRFGISARNS